MGPSLGQLTHFLQNDSCMGEKKERKTIVTGLDNKLKKEITDNQLQ